MACEAAGLSLSILSMFTSTFSSPPASAPVPASGPKPTKRGRPPKAVEERLRKVTTHITARRYAELWTEANVQQIPLAKLVRPLVEMPAQPGRTTTKELLQLVRQLAQLAEDLRRLSERSGREGFDVLAVEASFGVAELNKLLPNFKKLLW